MAKCDTCIIPMHGEARLRGDFTRSQTKGKYAAVAERFLPKNCDEKYDPTICVFLPIFFNESYDRQSMTENYDPKENDEKIT